MVGIVGWSKQGMTVLQQSPRAESAQEIGPAELTVLASSAEPVQSLERSGLLSRNPECDVPPTFVAGLELASHARVKTGHTFAQDSALRAQLWLLDRLERETLEFTYTLRPSDHGVALDMQLAVLSPTTASDRDAWRGDLRIWAAMFEMFSFRELGDFSGDPADIDQVAEAWHEVEVDGLKVPAGSPIGFTTGDSTAQVILPNLFGGLCQQSPAMAHTLQAARGLSNPINLRVRLAKVRLQDSDLSRFKGAVTAHRIALEKYTPAARAAGAGKLGADALESDLIDIRVAFQVPNAQLGETLPSIVSIFMSDLLPGYRFILANEGARLADSSGRTLDLRNFIAPHQLPLLLPNPIQLEAMGFPHHLVNPAVKLPAAGLLLGRTQLNGIERDVRIAASDRSRHIHIVGATGAGKSTLLLNMLRQDIEAGGGVCVIDPHGDLVEAALRAVPARRQSDVIWIDPSDESYAPSLNPLDLGDQGDQFRANVAINDLLDLFDSLYDMRVAGGPGFENYFRNLMLLICGSQTADCRASNNLPTVLTAISALRDKKVRRKLLDALREGVLEAAVVEEVRAFFVSADRTTGEQAFDNWVPYVCSKLNRLESNPMMRRMFCAGSPALNFRPLMDDQRIVLVNLSKGRLGRQDTRLLGTWLVKILFNAALSRGDVSRSMRAPFHLYLDEFHNFITIQTPEVMAEARKFGLHLVLAHQSLDQLDSKGVAQAQRAVLANAATRFIFRVGAHDAAHFEPEVQPWFDRQTLGALADRQVVGRVLVDNRPTSAFMFETMSASNADDPKAAAFRPAPLRRPPLMCDRTLRSDDDSNEVGEAGKTLAETFGALLRADFDQGQFAGELHRLDRESRKLSETWALTTSCARQTIGIDEAAAGFFESDNGSVLFISKLCALVIRGGHGLERVSGCLPGQVFKYDVAGHPIFKPAAIAGMSLARKLDIVFVDQPEPMNAERAAKHLPAWISAGPDAGLEISKGGWFSTHNFSTVYVPPSPPTGSRFVAIVCSGGHGVDGFHAAGEFSSYCIGAGGEVLLAELPICEKRTPLELIGGLDAVQLAQIAGMAVKRALRLEGTDLVLV
jgi:hypothetical protein